MTSVTTKETDSLVLGKAMGKAMDKAMNRRSGSYLLVFKKPINRSLIESAKVEAPRRSDANRSRVL